MREDQGDGIVSRAALIEEVDRVVFFVVIRQRCAVLRKAVELRLRRAPVEIVAPIFDEPLHVWQARTVLPVLVAERLVRKTRALKPALQVFDLRIRHMNGEGIGGHDAM